MQVLIQEQNRPVKQGYYHAESQDGRTIGGTG